MPLIDCRLPQFSERDGTNVARRQTSGMEAATYFTVWCTGQTAVLEGLASGLANAVFLAAVVTDRVSERCYGHRYRPEDCDDEKNLRLILGDDATPARRDHYGGHTGDEDADRNTG